MVGNGETSEEGAARGRTTARTWCIPPSVTRSRPCLLVLEKIKHSELGMHNNRTWAWIVAFRRVHDKEKITAVVINNSCCYQQFFKSLPIDCYIARSL